ncbi:hypothetical protein ACIQXV_07180 [Neobacillus sp. NPDC097160]|uniref:hypothetical protein n=1 Tax=Neobacillus sp. NPDC097160 TaxID=3364298 RepID=UPI00381FD7D8
MRKVLAITSFLFMFLVAVLPQHMAQAASTYTASITINGKDYLVNSTNNKIIINIDELVNQNKLSETDKVEKISITTPNGAKTISAKGTISYLFPEAKINVVNNKAELVVAAALGNLDPQQDGVAISTLREFLYPVNNQVTGLGTVDYGDRLEDLTLVLKATKQLNLAKGTPVNVTGLSLTASGKELKAAKIGDNKFHVNIAGVDDYALFQSIKLNSDTATTVSVFARNSAFYSDLTDVKFLNKEAVLNQEKVTNWAAKLGITIPANAAVPMFMIKDLLNETGITTLNGVVADNNGNESPFSLTIQTYGWVQVGGQWIYVKHDGSSAIGWLNDNGTWYYFDGNGVMKTGWINDGGKWYFLNISGAMQTGWVWDGGKWYFLKTDGAMQTGWVFDGGKWYFLNASGAMVTNWLNQNGTWYYFNAKNGDMATNWASVNGKWYFFDATSGAMKTNWVYSSGKWYFLDASGAMKTGWVSVGNKWYYLNNSGAMQTGWVVVNNKWYYLYSDGHMAVNTKIGSYRVGKDGAWIR